MPLPKPNKDEQENQFIQRCMGNEDMNKEYPDQAQRSAVCFDLWRKRKGESMEQEQKESIKYDGLGRRIIAENVPVILTAYMETEEDGGEN